MSGRVTCSPRGAGSGFIWDDAGHVITNLHVIEGASEATVKLADGRSFRATLVGASPAHDIAVLKIGVGFKHPPPVPVGSSHDLKVGQKVFDIGKSLRARLDAHHRDRLGSGSFVGWR